jgi:hypothetical protein
MYQGLRASREEEIFNETYDLFVRQSLPVFLTASIPNVTSHLNTALVCISADDIVDGSREPEGDFPPSSSVKVGASGAMIYVLGLATIVSSYFVF